MGKFGLPALHNLQINQHWIYFFCPPFVSGLHLIICFYHCQALHWCFICFYINNNIVRKVRESMCSGTNGCKSYCAIRPIWFEWSTYCVDRSLECLLSSVMATWRARWHCELCKTASKAVNLIFARLSPIASHLNNSFAQNGPITWPKPTIEWAR